MENTFWICMGFHGAMWVQRPTPRGNFINGVANPEIVIFIVNLSFLFFSLSFFSCYEINKKTLWGTMSIYKVDLRWKWEVLITEKLKNYNLRINSRTAYCYVRRKGNHLNKVLQSISDIW